MNILVIAPLPLDTNSLPLNGNQLPVKVLIDDLNANNNRVIQIDLSKKAFGSKFYFSRITQILKALFQIWKNKNQNDIVYLTIAESFLGNLRDIIIYCIFWNKWERLIIHMLGGAGMKNILTPSKKLQFIVNKYFISKIGAIIVEGNTQAEMFLNVAQRKNIHIIPNFAEDFLFIEEKLILKKFENSNPLKILFLSNMLFGKGHNELLDAYLMLDQKYKMRISLDFAGTFESENDKDFFMQKIKEQTNITFHGPVSGVKKKDLFHQSHVFCLPTYYPYEGQPFSIIEAMAAGCLIVTTNHSGIGNIFKDQINGFEVKKKSVDSLVSVLINLLENKNKNVEFGIYNNQMSKMKYTQKNYLQLINNLIKNI